MNEQVASTAKYDVVVVGGGINGVGIAADAAGRGLKVLLCEKGDLGCATSSASSKLIHGGLRYLEHYQFRLVREALAERELLLANAPHIMWPLRFRLPHQAHLRPAWLIRMGLFLYDHLAKRISLPRSKTVMNTAAGPLHSRIKTCFEYSDGWVDDARLVILNALAAQAKGATILPNTECTKAEAAGDQWRITLHSKQGGATQVVSRAIVNAAGPWAISVMERFANTYTPNTMRLVKGSHIVVSKMFAGDLAYILQCEDGRIVFVIPYEDDFTLIGTTDEDFRGDPQQATISAAEVGYLLQVVNHHFKMQLTQDHIVHSYSGVRPLLEAQNATAQELSRDYKVVASGSEQNPVLINIFGGKITTYRKLAEHAVDQLKPFIPVAQPAWTATAKLPGGDFSDQATLSESLQQEYPWLPGQTVRRYVRQYGTLCLAFLKPSKQLSDLGQDFGAGLYRAEVDYLVRREWACTVDDILWRRTKLGLRLSAAQVATLQHYLATAQPKPLSA